MNRPLNVLMINHHRRSKVNCVNRSLAMARYLARRGHQVTLLTTADHRKARIVESHEDGVHIAEIPDLLWGNLRSGWDPWSALNRILYLLRCEKDFDLIHLFESRPAVIHPTQVYRLKRPLPLIIDWVDGIGRGGILEVRRRKRVGTFTAQFIPRHRLQIGNSWPVPVLAFSQQILFLYNTKHSKGG